MGSRTDSMELAMAQDIFQDTGNMVALPANFYIALTTTLPTDTTAGTAASYTGYTRVAVARTSAQWSITSSGTITAKNINEVLFPTCLGNAQTIVGFEIWTASTGGTRLYWSALSSDVQIIVGSTPKIVANEIVITFD